MNASAEEAIQETPSPLDLSEVELSGWWRRVGAFILDNIFITLASLIAIIPFVWLIFKNLNFDKENIADPFQFIVSILFLFFIWTIIYFLTSSLYWGLLMRRSGLKNGQSLGQGIFNIRVARLNGKEVGFWWAFLRQIVVMGILLYFAASIISFALSIPLFAIFPDSDFASIISPVIYCLPYLANYLWPLWDPINQALHDKVVSSVVIKVNS